MKKARARAKTDDDDDDERDCGKIATTEPIKIDLLCLLLNLTINKKKGINPLISGMIARVKTTAIESDRDGTDERDASTILKSVK
jgi:hypothetical protein